MAKITVYQYEIPDPFSGIPIRARVPATRRAIMAAEGKLLADTACDVDLKWVTDDGVVSQWPIPETPAFPEHPHP
jgi:hypothetical protein